MTENILDTELGSEEKKKPSIINWASIIILWIGIGLCMASGMIGNLKLIIAIVLLAVTTAFTYWDFEKGVKTTMFVILVGVLGFIEFFPFKYEISFGIGGLGIGFEFVLIGVAILHYFTNREILKEPEKEISEEEKEAKFNKSKKTFKHHFSGRGIDDLKRLVEEGKIVAPAIAAAKELIEEKEKPT
ncbi:MAG: hypothetical protein R2825_30840 [Saprospiraceae bacterium]